MDDIATSYDLAGRVTSVSSANGTSLTNAYDTAGRLVSVTDQDSRVISYQYDDAGNRTRLTHPDGYFVDYTYDALNRMASAVENGTFTLATFGYDVQSRTKSLTYGNGASVSFDYEVDSDLKKIIHSFVSGGEALSGGGTGASYDYQYTPAHQLKSQTANHPSFQFEPSQTESIAYAVNNLNQYTTVGGTAIAYDPNGNLTNDGTNAFSYDAENKLTSATMGVGTNVTYEYGPIGRRVKKTVDSTVTEFMYDGDHLIAEYDGSGNVLRRYVHGPGTDRPIAMVDEPTGGRSYYHADRLGSVIALTDDSGAETARYTYDAYGIPYLVDPGTGALTQVAAGQPYLFTGRRFDFETGLYYYRARYYSASLGRFLQTDPIGYEDQMNLYAYVGNDPVNAWDPTGKEGCHPTYGCPGARPWDTHPDRIRGNMDQFRAYGAIARYASGDGRGFIHNAIGAVAHLDGDSKMALAHLGYDAVVSRSKEYYMGRIEIAMSAGGPVGMVTKRGATVAVLNTTIGITGSQLASLYSAYDKLNEAGVPTDALNSETLGNIAAAALAEAEFSYNSDSGTLTASLEIKKTDSRIRTKVSVDICVQEEKCE